MALLIIDLDKRIGNAERRGGTISLRRFPISKSASGRSGELADRIPCLHASRFRLGDGGFPNLKAMFSRSAGVEAFVNHPKLPKVPSAKRKPAGGDPRDD